MHTAPLASPTATATTTAARPPLAVVRDVLLLAKPRLSGLVVCTAAGGLWLAPGRREAIPAAVLLAGTTLIVGAANALNNFLERDVDARMRRTRNRPLPSGRIEPWVAVAVGLGVPSFALPALALYTNGLTAALGALALFLYVVVYTPMKRTSPLALFVGAVPGAIPPLMGWTAATGRLDAGGLALFALLFFWQLPHFLSVSLYLKDDYARGGLKVFAIVHGERATRAWIAALTLALVPVSLSLVPLGLAGPAYGAISAALGGALTGYAMLGLLERAPAHGSPDRRWQRAGPRWARSFFLLTLAYLTLLFAALLLGAR